MGVGPEVELAQKAGLAIGQSGGIRVDDQMQTSDAHIWAVGDAAEVKDYLTGAQRLIPLAGIASKQGRIAAEVILGNNRKSPKFRGAQATAVCGVLGLTVAMTGATEKAVKTFDPESELPNHEKIYLHPPSHPLYYPETAAIHLKLIFATNDGRILGAQAVGRSGVEKRIDVISMVIQKNGTIFDLEEAELCYSPQYGTSKDPVNLAGMAAGNVFRKHYSIVHWEELNKSDAFILDVRHPDNFAQGHVGGAVNIFLNKLLRERFTELPKDREIWIYCIEGERSYYAARILQHHGYKVKNLSGGYLMYQAFKKAKLIA
jgi:rhodanese-related sulfurtransferase